MPVMSRAGGAFVAAVLGVLLGSACDGEPPDYPYADVVLHPHALEGCRAPAQMGCAQCCAGENETVVLSSQCLNAELQEAPWCEGITPWYSTTSFRSCRLNGDPPTCASCTDRAEHQLRTLERPPACDCSVFDVTSFMDACNRKGSCECFCDRAHHLLNACPPVEFP